ncbi:conserved hypothetical protein [marine gamma proteobacterium HTCC2148]|jgi:uncharacterized protein (DUF934 family)|uniref:DUF934 domain-containing protein n=1 Tax=Candidatus Seongchinamella marina TaxID=2518990 RepID=A0ABT3ST82_9GAMM|nr:DUF934 domain-containing protein [Candidatus Seongchinamella marina]EEB79683.1 conserved hypothetical protein [marine gamma proteobacterium HTCC2148]MBT6123699.1 DUF934 domain-containing protein [Halieaceae bacterium]MCX2973140.1 DUF934 domain-containing protein [Candidatus Seongchinamella marina]
MPKLIKNGKIIEDQSPEVLDLEQWLQANDRATRAVMLEPGETLAPLLEHIDDIPLVLVNFPTFMDGRGFSYGRELRERGYRGELRAVGHFMRDQLTYLSRCGFDAFQFEDEQELEEALASLADFSEYYQASVDQPEPLFRRRA